MLAHEIKSCGNLCWCPVKVNFMFLGILLGFVFLTYLGTSDITLFATFFQSTSFNCCASDFSILFFLLHMNINDIFEYIV